MTNASNDHVMRYNQNSELRAREQPLINNRNGKYLTLKQQSISMLFNRNRVTGTEVYIRYLDSHYEITKKIWKPFTVQCFYLQKCRSHPINHSAI